MIGGIPEMLSFGRLVGHGSSGRFFLAALGGNGEPRPQDQANGH
jgi:hypothetical protein